jgi:hypothetical protein
LVVPATDAVPIAAGLPLQESSVLIARIFTVGVSAMPRIARR